MGENRVFVKGLGMVTPIGVGNDVVWNSLLEGKTNMRKIPFEKGSSQTDFAGIVDLDFFEHYDKFEHDERMKLNGRDIKKRSDKLDYYAVIASLYAVQDSGIDLRNEDNVGIVLGCGLGGVESLEKGVIDIYINKKGPGPFYVAKSMPNNICYYVSREFKCNGPSIVIGTACASGTSAKAVAYHLIKSGLCDIIITGGVEAGLTKNSLEGFSNAKALSKRNNDPNKASRPFDKNRDGFVLSEGAGIEILVSERILDKYAGKVYSEIVGTGMSTDEGYHLTMPNPETMILALQRALPNGMHPGDINYVNAHGTSTKYNDQIETGVYKKFFGQDVKNLLINSTKSMLGHTLGASGGIEGCVLSYSIKEGKVHPTINLEEQDPDCDLNYVPNKSVEANIDYGMTNSFAFGGQNASIVQKKIE